jgi:hypothetical protein
MRPQKTHIDRLLNQYLMHTPCWSDCPPGWADVVLPLLDTLSEMGATIEQVKEKFGGLRVYATAPCEVSDKVQDLIVQAEEKCAKRCQTCGRPGTLRNRSGYMATLCDDCI